jgi:hypothetical protein
MIITMNHTTLALVAVLAAAALVIGAVATPAFAGGYEKGTNTEIAAKQLQYR